jgi:hypothetical protein
MTKYEQAQNRISNLLRVANYQRLVKGNNTLAAAFEIKAKFIQYSLDHMSVERAGKCI